MAKSAIFTGVSAALFAAGLIVLFVALYHGGSLKTVLVAGLLFVATVGCWIAAARLKAREPI